MKMRQYERRQAFLRRRRRRGRHGAARTASGRRPRRYRRWPSWTIPRPGSAALPRRRLAEPDQGTQPVTPASGGLQTCVRWYITTDLRTNKVKSIPPESRWGRRDHQWLQRHPPSARQPPRRPPPPASATPLAQRQGRRDRRQATATASASTALPARDAGALTHRGRRPAGRACRADPGRRGPYRPRQRRRGGQALHQPRRRPRRSSRSSRRQVRRDLKKFERRGTTARNRVHREIKRTRTRVERELRQRRTKTVQTVKRNRREAERQLKATRTDVTRQVKSARRDIEKQVTEVQTNAETARQEGPGAGRDPLLASLLPTGWRDRDRGKTADLISPSAVMQYLSSLSWRRPSGRRWSFSGTGSGGRFAKMKAMPTEEQIKDALTKVIDPELRRNIVDLGMVRSIVAGAAGHVDITVSLTTAGCPIRSHFIDAVRDNVGALDGIESVGVAFDVLSDSEKQTLQQRLGRQGGLPQGALARVKNVVCVGSGKGGVGKSTLTANLAAALQAEGMQAAAMDADVWGYSIPRMLGTHGRPSVNAERKIIPLDGPGGVKVISIEFFLDKRGPGDHLARADAAQGDPPVPRGRRLGRARLPADRPAARDGRRVDDARPAVAPGAFRDRHDAPAGGPEGRQARRRDGHALRPRDHRRDREHVRASRRPPASASRSSAKAAGRSSPTSSRCRCSARCRSRRSCAPPRTRGGRSCSTTRTPRLRRRIRHAARGLIAATPQELAVLQAPSGQALEGVPEVTGTALPMAP